MPALPYSTSASSKTTDSLTIDHWQQTLQGHGIAYFRELVVEWKTLQWVNPHLARASTARRNAEEKAANVTKAEEALKKSSNPDDPALKKLLEEARSAALEAEQAAILAERKSSAAENALAAAQQMIENLIAKCDRNEATWSNLLEFESALVRLLPPDKLRAKYESLTEEYRGVTGSTSPEVPKDEDALRAKAETLLADLHWEYTTGPVQERQRSRMVLSLMIVTVLVFLLAAVACRLCKASPLPWVAMAGAAGAALSAFQRVQSRNVKSDALTNCGKIDDMRPWFSRAWRAKLWSRIASHESFALAPVIGAASAVVLAHIFASGLVSGSVFPTLAEAVGTNAVASRAGTNAATNVSAAQPISNPPGPSAPASTDIAGKPLSEKATNAAASSTNKTDLDVPAVPASTNAVSFLCCCWDQSSCHNLMLLLVWGFIAGFSERLVPDIVTRLAEKAQTAVPVKKS